MLWPAGLWAQAGQGREIPLGGRLIGPDGAPATGVEVRLVADGDDYERALRLFEGDDERPAGVDSAVTDEDGRWTLSAPAGRYVVLALTSRWIRDGESALPDAVGRTRSLVEPDFERDTELTAGREMRIEVTSGDEPAAGALVHGIPVWGRNLISAPRWARTDDDGVAVLPAFDGEKLRIEVVSPLGAPSTAENVGADHRIDLPAGSPRTVRVEDRAGRPVAGVLLTYGAGQVPVARTDASGLATLRTTATGLSITALAADGRRTGGLVKAPAENDPEGDTEPQVMVLQEPRRVHGRVIDQDSREPVAGALVSTRSGGSHALTDGAGGYSLAVFTPGGLNLQADAAGYFTGWGDVPAGSTSAPTLALAPAAYLDGRVVDADGQNLAGVHIDANAQPNPASGMFRSAPTSTSTRYDGTFRLGGLYPDTTYGLTATLDGFAPGSAEASVGDAREPLQPVEIVLDRGVRAFGRVVDESDRPVAGAAVSLVRQDDSNDTMVRMMRAMRGQGPDAEATTGADGLFTFAHVADGRYELSAGAPGFAPAKVPGIELLEGDESDLGTVVLSPGVSVHGIVTDSDGTPLAGAQIVAQAAQSGLVRVFTRGGNAPADAVSGADGTFVVPDQSPGGQLGLQASLAGYQDGSVEGVRAPNDEPARIVLQQSGHVAGQVRDDSGLPVADARVSAHVERGRGAFVRMMRTSQTTTDADGRFLLEDLPPSALQITAESEGYQPAKIGVEVAEGEVTEGVELVVRPGARISGTVFGEDGLPVIGAQVSLDDGDGGPGVMMFRGDSPTRTFTDGDGRYVLDGLALGTQTVIAAKDQQRASRVVDVRGGSQQVDLRFQSGVPVTGRVVDAAGLPVAGAGLVLQSSEDFSVRMAADSRPDGSFRFDDVAPGTYHLTGEASGLARTRSPNPVNVAAQPVSGVELRLTAAQVLVGRLLGADFDDLGNAQVMAFSQNGMVMGDVDFEGNFRIEGLAPGEWSLNASLADGRRASEQVTVEEGVPETVQDIDFDTGETLEGVVTSEQGPVQGVTVSIRGLDVAGSSFTEADTSGRFRFDGLDAGRYRVTAIDHQNGRSAEAEARVPGPEIDLELASLVVTGRVLDAWDGSPVSGAEIRSRRAGDDEEPSGFERIFGTNTASSDDTGSFRLPGLTPGSWEVTASKSGYATATQRLEVLGEGTTLELTLEPSEGLWLTVRRDDGAPVPKISLAVLGQGGSPVSGGDFVPDEEGRVFVSTVPPGTARILVQAPGTAPSELDVRVPEERPTVVLSQGAQIEVAVPELFDDPVRADLSLTAQDGRKHRTVGFAGMVQESFRLGSGRSRPGRATVSGVAAGAWTVTVTAADGRSWTRPLQVPGPGRLELVLE